MKKQRSIITVSVISLLLALAAIGFSQTQYSELNDIMFRGQDPQIRYTGALSFRTQAGTEVASLSSVGAWTTKRPVVTAASSTTALTAAQSGALVVNTGTSSTTTFTLPAAAAGLNYCFVEGGDAAGELLVGVTGTNTIVGRGITDTAGTTGATAIDTAASTGIKNTAATNVKGDFACVSALSTTTWYMTSVMGVWASR